MSLSRDPSSETRIPHAGTTDPMSIWEEVERPSNGSSQPENQGGKQQLPTPPKPEKKS